MQTAAAISDWGQPAACSAITSHARRLAAQGCSHVAVSSRPEVEENGVEFIENQPLIRALDGSLGMSQAAAFLFCRQRLASRCR